MVQSQAKEDGRHGISVQLNSMNSWQSVMAWRDPGKV